MKKKIVVHRMGVDCDKFDFSPRRLVAEEHIRLISIARLIEKKGLEYSIRAVAELAKSHNNFKYEVIGDGPLLPQLRALIVDLGIRHIVELVGWKEQDEVIEQLEKAHILVAPSVTSEEGDQEGIPVVLMEAMAMGLPVVSTQHSGIPELVKDGITGFLVPERSVCRLREKLKYLVEHPELWPRLGHAGREYVRKHYNLDRQNNRLVALYTELLGA